MSLMYDKGDICFACDYCPEVLNTRTGAFAGARNQLVREGWAAVKDHTNDTWKHKCRDCQDALFKHADKNAGKQ
jgi:hypothetical protein